VTKQPVKSVVINSV